MPDSRAFHLLIDIGNTFFKWGLFTPSAAGHAREFRVQLTRPFFEQALRAHANLVFAAAGFGGSGRCCPELRQ